MSKSMTRNIGIKVKAPKGEAKEGDKKGKIKVAAGGKKTTWLHTLAHEYAHFEYWKKNQTFRKSYILDEKRTEQRAIEILIEWNLPINIAVRIKKSKEYIKTLNNK